MTNKSFIHGLKKHQNLFHLEFKPFPYKLVNQKIKKDMSVKERLAYKG